MKKAKLNDFNGSVIKQILIKKLWHGTLMWSQFMLSFGF
jgi:hypothetical protein